MIGEWWISNNSWFVTHSFSAVTRKIYLVAKQEKLSEEMAWWIFPTKYLFLACMVLLAFSTILWHGTDGFTSSPKEKLLQILSPLKNPSSSTGFGPAHNGSNGKHATTKTSEGDYEDVSNGSRKENQAHNFVLSSSCEQKTCWKVATIILIWIWREIGG
jgi:hypothetical protein